MTDPDGVLEGGLDEPAELQPAEGSLRLVGDDDSYDATAWEAATAAVLRKARRLGEDAPDSDVWAALTRTTLDGIDVAPIGQQSDLDGLATGGRPQRAGAWDVRASLVGDDAAAVNEAALVDLDNGATSLHLDLTGGRDLGVALRGVLLDLAPVTLERPTTHRSEALAQLLEESPADPHPHHNLSADPRARVRTGREVFEARASVASPAERARLWPKLVAYNPPYAGYARKTEREIPVVILRRVTA